MDRKVAAVFDRYSPDLREEMLRLRTLIQDTAAATDGVGPLEETLKWGQVSYLTTQSGSGTTLRIDLDRKSGRPTVFVNCQTDLLGRYRALYPTAFEYDGNRGVVVGPDADEAALRHVIALALTYHSGKKRQAH